MKVQNSYQFQNQFDDRFVIQLYNHPSKSNSNNKLFYELFGQHLIPKFLAQDYYNQSWDKLYYALLRLLYKTKKLYK